MTSTLFNETPDLTEEIVRNVIGSWYYATNEHLPVERLESFLTEDVEMRYPNRPEPFFGREAFREWYADVLSKYFDEVHIVEAWDIALNGHSASAVVVVRWETRHWASGAARSEYHAYLSRQRFVIERTNGGAVLIKAKIVETFEETTPIHGLGR
jgi:hypothetical protein